jgi:hypothetical protein
MTEWETPEATEVDMSAEIGGYQQDVQSEEQESED